MEHCEFFYIFKDRRIFYVKHYGHKHLKTLSSTSTIRKLPETSDISRAVQTTTVSLNIHIWKTKTGLYKNYTECFS